MNMGLFSSADFWPGFTAIPLEHCEGFSEPCFNVDASWVRANTFYENERQNWRYLCADCAKEQTEYWDAQWKDAIG